jgi:hypothetical protein
MTQPSVIDTILEIQQVRDLFYESEAKLGVSYSSWDKDKDARITSFRKCANVLNDAQLGLLFVEFHLTKQEWWSTVPNKNIPTNDQLIYISEFVMFMKIGFLQFVFSSIESSFRLIVKSIDPTVCSNGTAEFKNIYSYLFTRINLQKWETLLDLLRCTRNSIHNNGVYFHRSGKDETINYKGINYAFVIGSPVNFVNWAFLISMVKDINDMLYEVITRSDVAKIPSVIDPFG